MQVDYGEAMTMNPLAILDWQRDIAAQTQISPNAKVVAFTLSHRVNGGTGDCFPSIGRIGKDAGISARHARRALHELIAAGHVAVDYRAGKSSVFCLVTGKDVATSHPIPATQDAAAQDALPLTDSSPPDTQDRDTPDRFVRPPRTDSSAPPRTDSSAITNEVELANLTEKTARPDGLVRTPPAEEAEEQDASPSPASTAPASSGRKSQPAIRIPADWQPDEASRKWIASFGVTDSEALPVITEFVTYWQKRTQKRADWGLAFRRNGRAESSLIKLKDSKQRRTQAPPLAPASGPCYRNSRDVLREAGL